MNRHVFIETPDVENGLELTLEQEHMCKVVYKKDTTNSDDGYFFHSLWNPEQDYDDEHIIVPLRSTDARVVTWEAGTEFANVIDSTYDPKRVNGYENKYWKELYGLMTGECNTQCATDRVFYDSVTREPKTGKSCKKPIVGGHVIRGQNACKIAAGSNEVFILPICQSHNSSKGIFMRLSRPRQVVCLQGYMQG